MQCVRDSMLSPSLSGSQIVELQSLGICETGLPRVSLGCLITWSVMRQGLSLFTTGPTRRYLSTPPNPIKQPPVNSSRESISLILSHGLLCSCDLHLPLISLVPPFQLQFQRNHLLRIFAVPRSCDLFSTYGAFGLSTVVASVVFGGEERADDALVTEEVA